jgi:hypothetical protein
MPHAETRTLNLRGKESLFSVRVLKAASVAATKWGQGVA